MQTLNVQQASELLHLNPKRVQGMARSGKLPAFRVGRKWLFDRDRLEGLFGHSAPSRPGAAIAISARNRLRGRISQLRVDGLMAEVTLRVGDQELVSLITRASAERMGLAEGDLAYAVIKSTEVMIGKEGRAE